MKVVILAGGFGTRLSEETQSKPKPLVDIGGYPIIWHIIKHYSCYGLGNFIVALGYKGEMLKKFFVDYLNYGCDLRIEYSVGSVEKREGVFENWSVELIDTGLETMTGGRVGRLKSWLEDGTFMLTYGDGVSNVDLDVLLALHRSEGRIGTVSAVRPPARFGGFVLEGNKVAEFTEKPQVGEGWINGGYMVFEPEVLGYIEGDGTILETHVLERLSAEGQLTAYRHEGFWQCVDTLRDLRLLNRICKKGSPPWKIWE